MIVWREGDPFWVQCRGEILGKADGDNFIRFALSGTDGTDVVASRLWFDQHATKIRPLLRFGDRLRIHGDRNRWVVVYEGGGGINGAHFDAPLIFPEGGTKARILTSETDWELIPREDDEE